MVIICVYLVVRIKWFVYNFDWYVGVIKRFLEYVFMDDNFERK